MVEQKDRYVGQLTGLPAKSTFTLFMSSYLGEFLLHAAELNPIEMENTYLWENQDFVVFISKIGKLILRKPSLLAFGKDFHL